MAEREFEFPAREEHLPAPVEFPQPPSATEYRPPDAAAEYSAPPGSDYVNPPEDAEFTPPGGGRAEGPAQTGRKRRLRPLLYGAAALVLLVLLFGRTPQLAPSPAVTPSVTDAGPGGQPASTPAPTPEPAADPTPEPLGRESLIETDFFCFSHEHHARIRLSNTAALHAVHVSVRETELDLPVYEHELSEAEIAEGAFELPVLSTGDVYMENMDAYDSANAWPAFEMTVEARFENEAGDGEDTLTLLVEPAFEMGLGMSYMRPDYTWSEYIPPDSFYFSPWEETTDIRYVINDPDAVRDPLSFSVDLSWKGRHASPEEYEEVVEKNEYIYVDREAGTETPVVSYTKHLVLRRPDWLPEEGTLHVHIVQYLASTGEKWVRDYDFTYPVRYD